MSNSDTVSHNLSFSYLFSPLKTRTVSKGTISTFLNAGCAYSKAYYFKLPLGFLAMINWRTAYAYTHELSTKYPKV